MIELRALGTFVVRDQSAGPSRDLPLAPRQSALLAFLTLARPRGAVSRDRLVGLFWPEHAEERARVALRQALYRLRVELGRDVVVSSGESRIEVLPNLLQCDAVMFDEACDAGRFETALALYEGDLLAGFFVSDAPAFDQWLELERDRYRQRAVEAATKLAQRSESAGNPAAAANHLRRALALAPYEEPVVHELVRVLNAIGDRSGAIHAYETFAARLARDLELEPTLALRTFVASLRNAQPLQQPERDATSRPRASNVESAEWRTTHRGAVRTRNPPRPDGQSNTGAAGAPPEDRTTLPAVRANRRPRAALIASAALAVGTLLGVLTLQWFADRGRGPAVVGAPELLPNRVLVLPLENRTQDARVATLGRMAADWIVQTLQRSGLVEVIDANTAFRMLADVQPITADSFPSPGLMKVSQSARAGIIVWGSLSPGNSSSADLELRVHIADAREGTVLRTLDPVAAAYGNPGPAITQLSSRVAGALATLVDARLATIVAPSSPPPTFEAYQEYAQGMDRFAPGTYAEAATFFARAAALDSSFITARFWQSYALFNSGQSNGSDSVILTIAPLRDRLPPAERAGLDVFIAEMRDDPEGALRATRRAAQLAPHSNWVYMSAWWANRLSRPREALASLTELDPTRGWLKGWPGYWVERLGAHHQLGEYEQQLAAARLALEVVPPKFHYRFVERELDALAALGRTPELDIRLQSLVRSLLAEGQKPWAAALPWSIGVELIAHGHRPESQRYFEQCRDLFPDNPDCLYESGHYADAYAIGKSRADSLSNFFLLKWVARPAARIGLRDEAERIIAGMMFDPDNAPLERARIAALLGQTHRAVELIREVLQRKDARGSVWYFLHRNLHHGDLDSIRDALLKDPLIAEMLSPPM